jgi:hypothetical protein
VRCGFDVDEGLLVPGLVPVFEVLLYLCFNGEAGLVVVVAGEV